MMQVVNVLLCRSRRKSLLAEPLFRNRLLWAGIAAEVVLILLIAYAAPFKAIFGTAPIGVDVWLLILPCAMAMIVFEEGRKAVARWRDGIRRYGKESLKTRSFPHIRRSRAGHSPVPAVIECPGSGTSVARFSSDLSRANGSQVFRGHRDDDH